MSNAQQIYQDFKFLYGELLFSHGFILKNHTFYRRHANDVLLKVSTVLRRPYFEVIFDAYPFSCAYTAAKEWRAWGVDWFMANRAKRMGEIYNRQPQDPYEKKMDRMFQAFSSTIFPEFNKVVSLDTYKPYDEWFHTSIGLPPDVISDVWVYLQQKDYLTAYEYIQKYLNDNAQRYAEKITCGDKSSYIAEYEFWMDVANKIHMCRYSEIDKYTQERVNVTSDACKKLGVVSVG